MKKCTKCQQTKELTEFYKNKRGKFGRDSRCSVCARKVIYKWQDENKEHIRELQKNWRENNKEYMLNKALEWNKLNPEKFKANNEKYKNRISGVYQIINKKNECLYVGQSKSFNSRKNTHMTFWRNPDADKQHPSLYKNLNKEGEIKILLIEECSKEILLEREKYWIEKLKPKYNA